MFLTSELIQNLAGSALHIFVLHHCSTRKLKELVSYNFLYTDKRADVEYHSFC